jgi:hypothetical protein
VLDAIDAGLDRLLNGGNAVSMSGDREPGSVGVFDHEPHLVGGELALHHVRTWRQDTTAGHDLHHVRPAVGPFFDRGAKLDVSLARC